MIVTFLFFIFGCERKQIATDFFEKIPEQKVAKLLSEDCVSNIRFGAGYSSGFAQVAKNLINTDKQNDDIQQMLIKNASLCFEVIKYDEARKNILNIIKTSNAYVADESESRNDFKISNTMKIRVPQSDFDNLIDSIISQCKNLDEKSINVTDVTEEYVDTESRLKAKREIENRYLEILKKAQNVKEILEVEQKLGSIREEIESAEGRLRYLSHQVSFSTINLTFYQNTNAISIGRHGFFPRIYSAFVSGWNGLTDFVIGLVSIWPFLFVVTGITMLIIRLIRRRKKKCTPQAEE
jgi:hypothetical protein